MTNEPNLRPIHVRGPITPTVKDLYRSLFPGRNLELIAYEDDITSEIRLFPHRARQDFYCEFVQPGSRLITRERLDAMLDPSIEPIFFKSPVF